MADAPDFTLLPVPELTRRTHRFRCEPYRATITAGSCVDRQDRAADQVNEEHTQQVKDRLVGDYEKCLRCAVGDRVRLQLIAAKRS